MTSSVPPSSRVMLRFLLVTLATIASSLLAAGAAGAHTAPVPVELAPAPGEELDALPDRLMITFDDEFTDDLTVDLLDPAGDAVPATVTVDGLVVTIDPEVTDVEPGTYRLSWRVQTTHSEDSPDGVGAESRQVHFYVGAVASGAVLGTPPPPPAVDPGREPGVDSPPELSEADPTPVTPASDDDGAPVLLLVAVVLVAGGGAAFLLRRRPPVAGAVAAAALVAAVAIAVVAPGGDSDADDGRATATTSTAPEPDDPAAPDDPPAPDPTGPPPATDGELVGALPGDRLLRVEHGERFVASITSADGTGSGWATAAQVRFTDGTGASEIVDLLIDLDQLGRFAADVPAGVEGWDAELVLSTFEGPVYNFVVPR